MHKKLVLVADGSRAHLLSAKGRKLHGVIHTLENEAMNSHEPKRLKESSAGHGHHYAAHHDPKDLERESFAKNLHDVVQMRMNADDFKALILVASPQMLGLLRKQMNGHISVDKALCLEATRFTVEQLEDRIFK